MKLDCRGLVCPQPVLETKKALEQSPLEQLIVLLDDAGSKENVRRFAESQGRVVRMTEDQGIFTLTIEKAQAFGARENPTEGLLKASGGLVVFLDSDSLGRGSEELGKVLTRSFLQVLKKSDVRPEKIILLNSGVKLACEGSNVLEDMQDLAKGSEVLSCGTCLDYFGLKAKLMAGRVSNMYEILDALANASKVIKF